MKQNCKELCVDLIVLIGLFFCCMLLSSTPDNSKANLKLSVERLKLQKKKRSNLADNEKRNVADLLAKGQDDEARIHTEQIIKEDMVCEAYEVIELFCELLLSRISVMKLSTAPPGELTEAIQTLCYAATRHQNLKELLVVRAILAEKYGKPYVQRAVTDADGAVNAAVVKKLAVVTPPPATVTKYMTAIAQKYDVEWLPEVEPDADGVFPETASSATVRPAAAVKTSASSTASTASPKVSKKPTGGDTIPIPPPDFGEEDFPEPPPDFGGGGAKPKAAVSQASSGMPSNFPVMSVSSDPAPAAAAAARPVKKPPAGAVSVMPAAKAAPASPAAAKAPAKAKPVVEVEDEEDDMDDLAARFAALKR